MNPELTEDEMRQALFGTSAAKPQAPAEQGPTPPPASKVVPPQKEAPKKKVGKTYTPRLRVTLRVGNEFEGKTFEFIHEADTLSTLLAEQEAVKAAKKKYRYIEVVSVTSM